MPAALAPARPAPLAATRVALCGPLVVEIRGRRLDHALPGRKGRQLLACLVVGRGRPLSRDELIDAVWAEKPPVDPDAAFSTLLTRTRSALGRDVIRGRGELTLDLDDAAWVDWEVATRSAAAAEARIVTGDLAGALEIASAGLAIARRPFLPDVSTRWIEDRRRELVELHAALLEASGRAALGLGGGHLPAAERSARELIEREPYRESAYALLMETHAARGNVAEALRVYDCLRRLLREELGLTPAPLVTALAERLLDEDHGPGTAPTRAPAPPAVPLSACLAAASRRSIVGREAALERLLAVCGEARDGRSPVVLVSGEAGIGKTRLVAELAARAHAEGLEVLHGRAQRQAVIPYQPFVEALRHHLRHRPGLAGDVDPMLGAELAELARVIPELRRTAPVASEAAVEPEIRRHRVFEAVSALVGAIARRRPALLILEDLQWADKPTLLLLRHVARSTQGAPLLVVLTMRDDEPMGPALRAALVDLARDHAFERHPLTGLDAQAVAELVTTVHGAVPEREAIAELWRETGGNPFLVAELLRGAPEGGLPAAIRDAIDARLDRLPAIARRVLAVAAAAGASFDVLALAASAEAPRRDTLEVLGLAARTGLLVADPATPGRFAFRHALVRRVVLGHADARAPKAS
jgi:DNA-binding SARP family transcriptional activator